MKGIVGGDANTQVLGVSRAKRESLRELCVMMMVVVVVVVYIVYI